ncbi:MAG: ribonuclease P protein subunit [Thermoplasmatota archaeon]
MKRQVPRLGPAVKVGKGEWIGQRVKITKSSDSQFVGLEGDVVDETLHTFTMRLEVGGRRIQVPKAGNHFLIDGHEVDGYGVQFRSFDRVKKVK